MISYNISVKKIIIAIPNLYDGGAQRVASVWAEGLAGMGYEVTMLLFHRTKNEYHLTSRVTIKALANSYENYCQLTLISRYRHLRSILKSIGRCVVVSFMPASQVWIMLASVGLSVRRIDTIRVNPWKISIQRNKLHHLLWRIAFYTSDAILLQANGQKEWLGEKNQKKSVLIPNPISTVYEDSCKQECSEQITEFIAVGRIVPQKNYEMMIDGFAETAKKYPKIKLRIYGVGESNYTAQINEKIHKYGLSDHIILMGHSENIHEEYKNADVFLMTSDYEGLPNALMEAMASRLLCISTDCPTGPRDLIDEGENGYLIPVGNATALVDTIDKVMGLNIEERTKMVDAGREKVMSYCSTKSSTEVLCKLIDSVVS